MSIGTSDFATQDLDSISAGLHSFKYLGQSTSSIGTKSERLSPLRYEGGPYQIGVS